MECGRQDYRAAAYFQQGDPDGSNPGDSVQNYLWNDAPAVEVTSKADRGQTLWLFQNAEQTSRLNYSLYQFRDIERTNLGETAWNNGVVPLKRFMSRQIDAAGNSDDVWLFYEYLPANERTTKPPETYEDVPLVALLPAFMLSELKVAFLIGFQIYLPFLILDLVVSSVTISMGMMMLPPVMISLPLKLLLFVLVDGWTLIVGMLLESFG